MEIHKQLELLKMQSEKDIEIEKSKVEATYKDQLSQKEKELEKLKKDFTSDQSIYDYQHAEMTS